MKIRPIVLCVCVTACASSRSTTAPAPTPTTTIARAPPDTSDSPPPPPAAEKGLIIDVPESGDVIIGGAPVAENSMRDHFAKNGGEEVAIIRAAESIAWGRIVLVLDHLRGRPNRGGDFVLAIRGDPKRRSSAIHFPNSSEFRLPPLDPQPGVHDVDIEPILVITITREGKRLVGERVVEDSLREALRSSQRRRVVIRADREVPFGYIVDVVIDAQAVGVNIAFSVSVAP